MRNLTFENKEIYFHYKPLRNKLRNIDLVQLFITVWHCSNHIEYNHPLPTSFVRFGTTLHRMVHIWDLLTIIKEGAINSNTSRERKLIDWSNFSSILKEIQKLKEKISQISLPKELIWNELQRIASFQFPWQNVYDANTIMRYYHIYNNDNLRKIIKSKIGIELDDFIAMGVSISGHFLNTPFIDTKGFKFYQLESPDASEKFFSFLGSNLNEFKDKCIASHCLDDSWAYNYNPIVEKPLVALDEKSPSVYFCPASFLIIRAITQGIYYRIYNVKNFDNSFGTGFEKYIGLVIERSISSELFHLEKPKQYMVDGSPHHGADWILSDKTANLFIECKTKRLNLNAKTELSGNALKGQLTKLSDAVIQLYKNISEALLGITNWINNDLPIYPLVITLEDWYLISLSSSNLLNELVLEGLSREGLDVEIIKDMPFSIMSASEAESIFQVIGNVSIDSFFQHKKTDKYSRYLLKPLAIELFGEEMRKINPCIFRSEFSSLMENRIEFWNN